MSQVTEDYEQKPARFGLAPSFIHAPAASPEDRCRGENLFDLFRHNGAALDVLQSVQVPFHVIDLHARVARSQRITTLRTQNQKGRDHSRPWCFAVNY